MGYTGTLMDINYFSTQFDFVQDHDQSSDILNHCLQLGTKSF